MAHSEETKRKISATQQAKKAAGLLAWDDERKARVSAKQKANWAMLKAATAARDERRAALQLALDVNRERVATFVESHPDVMELLGDKS
jgi:2-polyprenyl-6-methoxyphenol hydroxylase-like FAD-dependent oxidoreductase